jgi:hypothetical protein
MSGAFTLGDTPAKAGREQRDEEGSGGDDTHGHQELTI